MALYFAWRASESAERTVKLELEAQRERRLQRKLDPLDRLLLSIHDLREAATRTAAHVSAFVFTEAHGHYQVAYLAVSDELTLPKCDQLSRAKEGDVRVVMELAPEAASEVHAARKKLREEHDLGSS